MTLYNFHSHSNFSDGSNPPEDYIIEAINQGFRGYGFSEHSALPIENTFALQDSNEIAYCEEIRRLKTKYSDQLDIHLSLEADYIPGISEEFKGLKEKLKLDYMIGSIHLVKSNDRPLWFIDGHKPEIYDEGIRLAFDNDIIKAITAYWHQTNQMIESEEFDIVGHLDKIKMHNKGRWFDEEAPWYEKLVDETLDLISEKHLLVEINTRGLYKGRSTTFFPGDAILSKMHNRGIGVVISSDAHHPSEISLYFNEAAKTLSEIGFKSIWIYNTKGWVEQPLQL